jgi:hypothetical protein
MILLMTEVEFQYMHEITAMPFFVFIHFFSCSKMTQLGKQTAIFDLSLDTKLAIISYLDNRSLANLSKTCSYFGTDNNFTHPHFTPA